MKNKRVLSLLLAVMILLSSLPFAGVTAFAAKSGDFEYRVLDDGTAEITGYNGYGFDITIPSELDGYTVTSIGDYAFYSCYSIESIIIPNTVKRIGYEAFYFCTELTDVTMPDKLKSIGKEAFLYCGNLKNITIPKSVTSIGDHAFADCKSLTSVTIPNGIKSIGTAVFADCSSLTSVTIPNSVTSIGESAFAYCSNLTNITIPNSVTSIGDGAFESCESLASITIPNSVKNIGSLAFNCCYALKKVTIPSSVTSIGKGAFSYCISLPSITVDSNNKNYSSQNGVLFNKNKTILLQYPSKKADKSYSIPNGVKKLEYYSFAYNTALESVTIPSSIEEIGESAFEFCTSLKEINMPATVKSMEIKKCAFYGCYKLASIELPDGTTAIRKSAFLECKSLKDIIIPTSLKVIEAYAFEGCESLKNIYYPGSAEQWFKIAIDYDGNSTLLKNGITIHNNYVRTPKISSVSNVVAGVKISWGKVSGATKYRVYYKTGKDGWTKIADTTSTSYTWTGAKSGTKYSFTVRCISNDGKSFTSGYDSQGKSSTYIAAPKLSSVANTTTGVQINWGKVTGAAKYRVFYKTGNGSWQKLTDTTSTSYTWKGAKKGTKYTFTVRCISDDGKAYTSAYDSTGKSITCASSLATPKLSSVSNVVAGVKISWGKVAGAAKYRVFYKTANGKWTKAGDTDKTSFTWTKAKNNTKYTFTVRCIDKNGNYISSYDSTGKSIMFISAPTVKVAKASNGVKITWSAVKGASKYIVYRKTVNGSYKAIKTVSGTSYIDTSAKKGTKYIYTVRCADKNGKTISSYNAGKSIIK
ncbi:MAG: leucine-rich repeat protein [Eubacterium sp.]|nr:leucine-rich repeat protein [Eubacterium sp.]